ncbi:MAG: nucleoside triphosphate pyrophosphohydrolase [bacterium]|nr:nucleoside triphosphate pyrophosphohydrolase [bacterium]
MGKIYNKLVRDKIPNIIMNNGEVPITKILSNEEYKKELYSKLLEESEEVISAEKEDNIIEELADVLEVIKAIAELNEKTLADVNKACNEKRLNKGGFKSRVFLEKTI